MIGTNNRTEKLNKTVRHRPNLRLFHRICVNNGVFNTRIYKIVLKKRARLMYKLKAETKKNKNR